MESLAAQAQHARTALEWSLLLDRIAERCESGAAAAYVRALLPAETLGEARQRLQRMHDAVELFNTGHPPPVRQFAALSELFDRLRADGVASGPELWALHAVLSLAAELRVYAKTHRTLAPDLARAIDSEPSLERLRERLAVCIESGGAVADRASPELARARDKVRDAQSELKRRLGQMLDRFADLLQGQYYTEREGRFVLPVRSDAHLRVDGIVHGSSASGSTLFVEPRELTHVGNRLRLAEAESAREEDRVLAALSAEVKALLDPCEAAFFACIAADALSAGARWASETQSVVPTLADEARLELREARHPLLLLSDVAVVPNDIVLQAGQALIISGPNAGGKTVALKTAGLVTWMAQSGLPVPLRADSIVGWFDRVLCDIGDEQSIVRSLSTFSAHIVNLCSILRSASPSCLVLLDEVAAGTDPEEGAALAAALLEALTSRGAAVGVTTHYERLKELATHSGCFENASVGFDFAHMAPTFRLHLGVPGPSSALAVARRYGLPEAVISRAQALLPTHTVDREATLRELSRERAELDATRTAAELDRREAREMREALEGERRAFREQAAREADRELRELRIAVRSARKELEDLRARLRSTGADEGVLRELERGISSVAARVALGGELSALDQQAPKQDARQLPAHDLRVGQMVRHRTLGTTGQVIELCARDQVRLMIGAMKLLVPIRDLTGVAERDPPKKKQQSHFKYETATPPKPALTAQRTDATTLDLRGQRYDEALGNLDGFIDRLIGVNESAGFVLHGHGTGALKAGVREHLRASAYVEHSRPAEPDEGGDAFTVFWLRG